jgi:hypothetical protein
LQIYDEKRDVVFEIIAMIAMTGNPCNQIGGCKPETEAKYRPALELYTATALPCVEVCRQCGVIGVLDKFIHEGHEALSSFAKTDRVNFNDKESASIYYGIMASAVKHNIELDSKALSDYTKQYDIMPLNWRRKRIYLCKSHSVG